MVSLTRSLRPGSKPTPIASRLAQVGDGCRGGRVGQKCIEKRNGLAGRAGQILGGCSGDGVAGGGGDGGRRLDQSRLGSVDRGDDRQRDIGGAGAAKTDRQFTGDAGAAGCARWRPRPSPRQPPWQSRPPWTRPSKPMWWAAGVNGVWMVPASVSTWEVNRRPWGVAGAADDAAGGAREGDQRHGDDGKPPRTEAPPEVSGPVVIRSLREHPPCAAPAITLTPTVARRGPRRRWYLHRPGGSSARACRAS